jgi:alpha-amylase
MHGLQAVMAREFPGRIVVVETRRPVRHWWITAALLASFAACSGNDRFPSVGTGPTATPTGLTISGADTVLSGLSETYAASVTFANGTSKAVIPAWSTDDGNIATINAAGQLTALRNGTTRIVATAGGLVGASRVSEPGQRTSRGNSDE